jgi:hypothetical protein
MDFQNHKTTKEFWFLVDDEILKKNHFDINMSASYSLPCNEGGGASFQTLLFFWGNFLTWKIRFQPCKGILMKKNPSSPPDFEGKKSF